MSDRNQELMRFRREAQTCEECRAGGLLYDHPSTRPLFPLRLSGSAGVLGVFEAPNWTDTVENGYLTIGYDSDPTAYFATLLLEQVAGVEALETVFTNSVLCLPKEVAKKYPVGSQQRQRCLPWLEAAIGAANPRVVIAFGAQALAALDRVVSHGLTLARDAGKAHDWHGRKLVPLYHPGLLGRANRKTSMQLLDCLAVRREVHGEGALPTNRVPVEGELCGLTKLPGYSGPAAWHSVCRLVRHEAGPNGTTQLEFVDYLYAEGVQKQVVEGLTIPAWGDEYFRVWEEWPPRRKPKNWRRVCLRPLTWDWARQNVVPRLGGLSSPPRDIEQFTRLFAPG